MTDASMEYVEALEKECMKTASSRLESCVQTRQADEWLKEAFMSDENKVQFYTGLPSFTVLIALLNFITTHGSRTHSFREYIAVLMKLRLSFYDQDIAYRFGIHQSNASQHFRKWIDIMFIRLKPLIKWPQREELQKTMPMDFQSNFIKCVVNLLSSLL